jgi:hypothetical protein
MARRRKHPVTMGRVHTEAEMFRKVSFLAALVWVLIPSAPSFAQDQPSLGDVARQARKDKEKNNAKPATIITDDTLPSKKGLGGLSLGDLGSSQGPGNGNAMAQAMARIEEAEAGLKQMDALDRTTLAKAALLDNDVDFPNRRAWEDRLYAAKDRYVSHERELITEIKQIAAQVQSLRASQGADAKLSPADPRAQQMLRRIQEIIQDAIRTEQVYRAVVMEGWDLAKQAKH